MSSRSLRGRPSPRSRPFPRALVLSIGAHAVVLGAGAVLGGWGSRALHRAAAAFQTRLETPPDPLPLARESLPEPELPELEEPQLVESEVWSRPEAEPPAPEATPLRWPTERPMAIGHLPEPCDRDAAEPEPEAEPEAAPVAARAALEVAPPSEIAASPIYAPPPSYPRRSVRSGEEGTVLLRLYLTDAGRVERVEVLESSGHDRLDEAARTALQTWRFSPRTVDGLAVPGRFEHRVTFQLDRD